MYWNPTQVNNNMMQLELQQLGLVQKSILSFFSSAQNLDLKHFPFYEPF